MKHFTYLAADLLPAQPPSHPAIQPAHRLSLFHPLYRSLSHCSQPPFKDLPSQAHVFAIFLWIWNKSFLRMCVNKQTEKQMPWQLWKRQQGLPDSESCDRVFTQGVASYEWHTEKHTIWFVGDITKFNVRFMQNWAGRRAHNSNKSFKLNPKNSHQGQCDFNANWWPDNTISVWLARGSSWVLVRPRSLAPLD